MARPTLEQLAEWTLAALANGRRLFDDSRLLLEAGRSTSAMVLLGLAADEIGKHMMIMAMPSRADSDAEWKKFDRRIRSHTEKLGNPLLSDWIMDLLSLDDPPDPAVFHELRLAATYTDLVNGEVRVPSGVVDSHAVSREFERIGRMLHRAESMFGGADSVGLAEAMHRVRASAESAPARSHSWTVAYAVALANGAPELEAERLASLFEQLEA